MYTTGWRPYLNLWRTAPNPKTRSRCSWMTKVCLTSVMTNSTKCWINIKEIARRRNNWGLKAKRRLKNWMRLLNCLRNRRENWRRRCRITSLLWKESINRTNYIRVSLKIWRRKSKWVRRNLLTWGLKLRITIGWNWSLTKPNLRLTFWSWK